MASSLGDTLTATLRRHNPSKVRAYSGDEFRDIAVPTRRRKWAQVVAAIEALSWSRVELLDKAGAVIAYVDNTGPAGDLEDVGERAASSITQAERIVALVLKGQRETMTFRDSEVTQLLKAQGDVMREMVSGMRALTQIYQAQVEAASEVAALQATAAAGEGGSVKELIDAAPQIIAALPAIKSLLSGGK